MSSLDTWLKEDLRTKDYEYSGDAYNDQAYQELRKKWSVDTTEKDTYLQLVRAVSDNLWTHLRLLADFMEIGRIPRNWKEEVLPEDRQERWGRSNIRIIDYSRKEVVRNEAVHGDIGLDTKKLKGKLFEKSPEDTEFRLYVVEDLSRNVIEVLGSQLKIDPEFFRAHIVDYAWHNVRGRWWAPRPLGAFRKRRKWFQIRWMKATYFETEEDFKVAAEQAKGFNILRRPGHDGSKGWWDSEKSVVAQTRSRATYWIDSDSASKPAIGVLLLDPNVSQGFPLWGGQYNFHPIPTTLRELKNLTKREDLETSNHSPGHKHSLFQDFVYWAGRSDLFAPGQDEHHELVPMQVLLHLVGSEWLTICDYTKTRLNQIELEIKDPKLFSPGGTMDAALDKLHIWRKCIPLYREMVSETLRTAFQPSFNRLELPIDRPLAGSADTTTSSGDHSVGDRLTTAGHTMWRFRMNQDIENLSNTTATVEANNSSATMTECKNDFDLIMKHLDEYQSRIDQLTSVATAVMALKDSRRANRDARNLGLLTWLATFFLPFGVVSGILSLQKRSEINLDTIQLYFQITLPLSIFTLALGWALHTAMVRGAAKHLWDVSGKLWKRMNVSNRAEISGPDKTKERAATHLGNDDVEKGTMTSSLVAVQGQSTTMRRTSRTGLQVDRTTG